MNMRELELAVAAADPLGQDRLDGIDLEALEAELLADLDGEQQASPPFALGAPPRRRPRRLALALGCAVLAAIAAAIVVLAGATSESPEPAYGAELVRFAESTPLLLLEGPSWRVQNVYQTKNRAGSEGSMEFVTGKPIPYESITIHKDGSASGLFPPAVRQRRIELWWRNGSLAEALSTARKSQHPHGQRWVELPVVGTTAQVDTRTEFFPNQGGPGNRQMTAFWSEGGYVLELRAAVPDLAAFEERLGWLRKVDSETWLDAMPAKVVKAADHDSAVREMLQGIPVPAGFDPADVPDEGVTTNRYQVGARVTGVVSCMWLRQWGQARRSGDGAKQAEAERAMATARHWPILHEMASDGAYPQLVWEVAADMQRGYWKWGGHRHPLLPHAEGLGCAGFGIPLKPKQ